MNHTTLDAAETGGAFLPVDPFESLRAHFGMLLGVDDFETIDAYHRGKMWLHNAWLHREGVVWGLGVELHEERREIRVRPGLALDRLGRELYLGEPHCLHVGRWYEEHAADPELQAVVESSEEGAATTYVLDAHVTARFRSCLARQVPAMAEPCAGADATTAYSRVLETVELRLVPGPAPERGEPPRLLPYHRLRLLFGLDEPRRSDPDDPDSGFLAADQEVVDERQRILGLMPPEQPGELLAAFRRFAALDAIELVPPAGEEGEPRSLLPSRDPDPLVLAEISGLTLRRTEEGWHVSLAGGGGVDNTVRSVHVATATIQELLCGFLSAVQSVPLADEAGGPRIDPSTVAVDGSVLSFTASAPLAPRSVQARAISVSSFSEGRGWTRQRIEQAEYNDATRQVVVRLHRPPRGDAVKLVVRGTGEHPLIGVDHVPLAGAVGGPPGSEHDGHDFVYMFERSS